MMRLLTSISEASEAVGTEAGHNWVKTIEGLWYQLAERVNAIAVEDKIQITSPPGG
jgi:hypothetical protein